MISIKSQRELDRMRKAGEVVMLAHKRLEEIIAPGVTTKELDRVAAEVIKAEALSLPLKASHAPTGMDFPGVICASVNDEVIHGIPGDRVLKDGDIISIDIGAILDGFHGDAARTYPVGKVSSEAMKLIRVTEEAFNRGMAHAVEGNRIRDISRAVQSYVEENGFSVVRDYVGHGIGREMHEEPQIPNYVTPHRESVCQPE